MAARPSLLCNRHDTVLRPWNGAAYEQKVSLSVYPDDPQSELGVPFRTHVARHPLALDDPRWIGARADRARLPVPGVAVGRGTTTKAVAVHHALEPPALRGPGDLHQLARREDVDLDLRSRCRGIAVDREHPQNLGGDVEARL